MNKLIFIAIEDDFPIACSYSEEGVLDAADLYYGVPKLDAERVTWSPFIPKYGGSDFYGTITYKVGDETIKVSVFLKEIE